MLNTRFLCLAFFSILQTSYLSASTPTKKEVEVKKTTDSKKEKKLDKDKVTAKKTTDSKKEKKLDKDKITAKKPTNLKKIDKDKITQNKSGSQISEKQESSKLSAIKEKEADSCRIKIFGTDRMQYVDENNKLMSEITVPHTCSFFTLDFHFKGKMSSRIMGHNIVVTNTKDKEAVSKEALSRGKTHNYLPSSGPKVIAASLKTLGGAKEDFSEEEILVDMSKIDSKEKYSFFCSFPGHSLIMNGSFKKEAAPKNLALKEIPKPSLPKKKLVLKQPSDKKKSEKKIQE